MESIYRIGAWLRLLNWKLETGGNQLLRESGITVMQLRVLRYLRLRPDQAQIADIAAFFGVKHTSTLHVVRAMEEKGLVRREAILHSRRNRLVLTEAGLRLALQNETVVDYTEEVMLDGFTEEEKTQLFAYMNRINDNLDKGFDHT